MIPVFSMTRLLHNPHVDREGGYPEPLAAVLNPQGIAAAYSSISQWSGYAPTPLTSLQPLAGQLGVGSIAYKDEAARFGLGSFKALGGAYAVQRVLSIERARRKAYEEITVACATDGNHGRSVAWAAHKWGCRCVIFLHENVSIGREEAISRYGARIVRIAGNYDDSVRAAAAEAHRHGWFIVSDTSYAGYTEIPSYVMHGYTVLSSEIFRQLPQADLPTHLLVQAGVGGLAAALVAHFWMTLGSSRPITIVVEPDNAACLFQSGLEGSPVAVPGDCDTVMAGLACGEPSLAAWEVLSRGADFFCTVPDGGVPDMMERLARGTAGPPVVAGESAVAGLLLLAGASGSQREQLGLDERSRVLVIGTEGATDPEIYRQMTGQADVTPPQGGRS